MSSPGSPQKRAREELRRGPQHGMLPRAEHICEGRWGSIVPKPIILEEDRPIYPQIAEQLVERFHTEL